MNKAELIARVAESTGTSKTTATQSVYAVIAAITEQLIASGEVRLPNFGTFKVEKREAKIGRNPRTGESLTIPAKQVPKFVAGTALKNAVNQPIQIVNN
jgi:DNA-binding protein HU-beta